ncbi:MAG: hypothetical protein KME16_18065 [Scytolyngbya sp. HA4215-MV1]|nr:hypothetical protein [Scytolyngbya sp. HA4215-MV1]
MKKTMVSLLAMTVLFIPGILALSGCSDQSPQDPASPSSSPKPSKRPQG